MLHSGTFAFARLNIHFQICSGLLLSCAVLSVVCLSFSVAQLQSAMHTTTVNPSMFSDHLLLISCDLLFVLLVLFWLPLVLGWLSEGHCDCLRCVHVHSVMRIRASVLAQFPCHGFP